MYTFPPYTGSANPGEPSVFYQSTTRYLTFDMSGTATGGRYTEMVNSPGQNTTWSTPSVVNLGVLSNYWESTQVFDGTALVYDTGDSRGAIPRMWFAGGDNTSSTDNTDSSIGYAYALSVSGSFAPASVQLLNQANYGQSSPVANLSWNAVANALGINNQFPQYTLDVGGVINTYKYFGVTYPGGLGGALGTATPGTNFVSVNAYPSGSSWNYTNPAYDAVVAGPGSNIAGSGGVTGFRVYTALAGTNPISDFIDQLSVTATAATERAGGGFAFSATTPEAAVDTCMARDATKGSAWFDFGNSCGANNGVLNAGFATLSDSVTGVSTTLGKASASTYSLLVTGATSGVSQQTGASAALPAYWWTVSLNNSTSNGVAVVEPSGSTGSPFFLLVKGTSLYYLGYSGQASTFFGNGLAADFNLRAPNGERLMLGVDNGSNTATAQEIITSTGATFTSVTDSNLTSGNCVQASTSGLLTSPVGPCATTPGTQAFGIATLSSGTVTVSNAAACTPSATCVYKLTNCALNGSAAVGTPGVGTISVGTSFVINSYTAIAGVAVDSSKICWQIN
jgi:hypothetical protein